MTAQTPAPQAPGLKASFGVLLDHLASHLALLRLEAGHELSRLGQVLGFWAGIVLTLQLTLNIAALVLIASFWNTQYRYVAIAASIGGLLLLAAWMWSRLKHLGAGSSKRFEATAVQWQRDIDVIKSLL